MFRPRGIGAPVFGAYFLVLFGCTWNAADEARKVIPGWSVVEGTPVLPVNGLDVAWSPDGTRLALAHGGGAGLTVINTSDWSVVAGTPSLPDVGRGVAWSPDGTRLAVAHDGGAGLMVIKTSDWAVVTGTPIWYDKRGVAWSPDGARLAFAHLILLGSGLTVLNVPE